jgi:SAM-dependent methyltransferase
LDFRCLLGDGGEDDAKRKGATLMKENTAPGAPLWNVDELEWLGRCPSCMQAPRYLRHASAEDRLFGTGTANWRVWSCRSCKCTYLDPRPKAEVIDRAYRSYFTHNDPLRLHQADNGSSFAWRMVNGYLHARFGMDRTPRSKLGSFVVPLIPGLKLKLDYFAHHLPKPNGDMTCLDVGCGNGLFLLRAKSAGWIVKGIDFDDAAISQARAAGIDAERNSVTDHLVDHRQHYAAVTLSHVLEHMHDPESFLLSCRELLHPGGMLWIATPNVASLGHRYFGVRWYSLDASSCAVQSGCFMRVGVEMWLHRCSAASTGESCRIRHQGKLLAHQHGRPAR